MSPHQPQFMETKETKLQDQEAVQKLKDLAEDVHVCMFTTMDENGGLSSRPMFTSSVDEEGNVWFFTNEFSEKINEVSKDNIVHLIYAHPAKNIYLDVEGTCSLVIDRKKMDELWNPELKKWFPDGLEDPKICLVKVVTEKAYFWYHTSSKMGLLFQMIRSITKGDQYKENEKGKLDLAMQPEKS
jgi:general stress protein 26